MRHQRITGLPYVFGLDELSYLARAAFRQSSAYEAADGFHRQASPIQMRYAGSVGLRLHQAHVAFLPSANHRESSIRMEHPHRYRLVSHAECLEHPMFLTREQHAWNARRPAVPFRRN